MDTYLEKENIKLAPNYICFEGVDYTGKTLFINMLAEKIDNCLVTKEPGSPHSEVCKNIRATILNSKGIKCQETYGYLFAADTHEHLNSVVIPALKKGKSVLSDRCVVSDYAYRPTVINSGRIENTIKFKTLNPIVIYLTSDLEVVTQRIRSRNNTNIFERTQVFHRLKELKHGYEVFLNNNSGFIFKVIENNDSIENCFFRICEYLKMMGVILV